MTWESTSAWRELLEGLQTLDATFLAGPRAVEGEQSVAEGYRFLATVLSLAFDINLFADTARPRFTDVNTPFRHDRRWGGDNTDAYYAFAPVDPQRSYRVSGQRGDSVYFSLTCYNEPTPGQWSNRVVGIINDDDLDFDDAGRFSFLLGPSRPPDYSGPFLSLTSDAAALLTRDYQLRPQEGQRVTWEIASLDPAPVTPATDAGTARALRAALLWSREMFAIVPLTVDPREERTALGHNSPNVANAFATPYQVGDANYGWSARDACYSFASFVLEADEALVISHRPPDSRFWNLTIWNQFMAGHDLEYARTSVNSGTAVPNADGTVTVVVSQQPLDHPNALTTAGHPVGILAFRWFHADRVPDCPEARLIKAEDVRSFVT